LVIATTEGVVRRLLVGITPVAALHDATTGVRGAQVNSDKLLICEIPMRIVSLRIERLCHGAERGSTPESMQVQFDAAAI